MNSAGRAATSAGSAKPEQLNCGEAQGGEGGGDGEAEGEGDEAHFAHLRELRAQSDAGQRNEDAQLGALVEPASGVGIDYAHRAEEGQSKESQDEVREGGPGAFGGGRGRDRGPAIPPPGDKQQ